MYCSDHYHIFRHGWRPPHIGKLDDNWHISMDTNINMKENDPDGYNILNKMLKEHMEEN